MVGVEVAIVEEGEVVAVVLKCYKILEVLVRKVFQCELDVVTVEEELSEVLEFEDVGDLEPFEDQE